MIQYQILQTDITRTVWQTIGRITNEILGVNGIRKNHYLVTFGAETIIESFLLMITYLQSNRSEAQKLTKKKQSSTRVIQAVKIQDKPLNFNHQHTTK